MNKDYYSCSCEATRAQGIAVMCMICDNRKIPKTMIDIIRDDLMSSRHVLTEFLKDEAKLKSIQNAADIMINCLKNGGKIIACGNGGSMCDAMHFASELTGKYRKDRPPIAAVAISDPAHLSCVGNDYGYEEVFARYVHAHGKEGDVLLALSTSGNSENVKMACLEADRRGMHIVFITGASGGSISEEVLSPVDVEINVPYIGPADRIQETTIVILHILVHLIEKGLGYE